VTKIQESRGGRSARPDALTLAVAIVVPDRQAVAKVRPCVPLDDERFRQTPSTVNEATNGMRRGARIPSASRLRSFRERRDPEDFVVVEGVRYGTAAWAIVTMHHLEKAVVHNAPAKLRGSAAEKPYARLHRVSFSDR
jgi:hypothetical protein